MPPVAVNALALDRVAAPEAIAPPVAVADFALLTAAEPDASAPPVAADAFSLLTAAVPPVVPPPLTGAVNVFALAARRLFCKRVRSTAYAAV